MGFVKLSIYYVSWLFIALLPYWFTSMAQMKSKNPRASTKTHDIPIKPALTSSFASVSFSFLLSSPAIIRVFPWIVFHILYSEISRNVCLFSGYWAKLNRLMRKINCNKMMDFSLSWLLSYLSLWWFYFFVPIPTFLLPFFVNIYIFCIWIWKIGFFFIIFFIDLNLIREIRWVIKLVRVSDFTVTDNP